MNTSRVTIKAAIPVPFLGGGGIAASGELRQGDYYFLSDPPDLQVRVTLPVLVIVSVQSSIADDVVPTSIVQG
jgi:hypothetical protein